MRGSDSDEEESVSLEAEESDTVEGDDFGDEAKALILEDMEAIFKRQQKANVEWGKTLEELAKQTEGQETAVEFEQFDSDCDLDEEDDSD